MKIVKFTRSYAPYNSGDGAAFEDHRADALVNAGVAVLVTAPVTVQPTVAPKSEAVTAEIVKKVPVDITTK